MVVMDFGNTAWVMISTALVLIMVPGVGIFYSGMVRKKNAIAMMALSFVSMALVSVQWVAVGYSLSFGPDLGGVIGGLNLAGLRGLGTEISGLPSLLFVMF
jgi:Amt family ammonium transporter